MCSAHVDRFTRHILGRESAREDCHLPTMHCLQWDILYSQSCGSLVMKDTLGIRQHPNFSFWVYFIT